MGAAVKNGLSRKQSGERMGDENPSEPAKNNMLRRVPAPKVGTLSSLYSRPTPSVSLQNPHE